MSTMGERVRDDEKHHQERMEYNAGLNSKKKVPTDLRDIPRREVEVRADRHAARNAIEFYLRGFMRVNKGNVAAYPDPITLWADETHGAFDPEPTFSLTPENAIMLMDDMWRAGVRPTDHQNVNAVVAAKDETIAALMNLLEHANTVSQGNRDLLGSALETISQIALRGEFEEEEEEEDSGQYTITNG